MSLLKKWKFLILAALVILSGVGYYVLYGQKTVQGNVNINKIESIDKVYSYSVHSDFYFRVEKYDKDGKEVIASYSKLIPLKTSIGYDFANDPKNPKITLLTTKTKGRLCLDDTNGRDIERYIKTFSDYAKTFGTIVATQDQAYFDKSAQKIESILKSLYGDSVELPVQDIDKYYTSLEAPVLNMRIKYYKLEEINKNLKSFKHIQDDKIWQPNIAEWRFGENDRIYLQYLKQKKVVDLYDYLKIDKKKKDALIVKTVKIHNGKLDKIYFKIKLKENKIECLFMDDNGHIYSLIMKTENETALRKYLPDFLKIAYGINFIDVKHFDNWFAKEQREKNKYFKAINNKIDNINVLCTRLENSDKECKKSIHSRIDEEIFDKKFETFKEMHGHYPDEKMLDKLNQVATDLEKKVQDNKGIISKSGEYYNTGKEHTSKIFQDAADKISVGAKSATNAVSNAVSFMGDGEEDPIEQKEEANESETGFSFGGMWKSMKGDSVEVEVDNQNEQDSVIELEVNATKVLKEEAISKLNNFIGFGGEGKLKEKCPNFSKSCMQEIIEKE